LGVSKSFNSSSSSAWSKDVLIDVIVQRIKALSPEGKTHVSQEDPVLRAVAIAIAIEQVMLPINEANIQSLRIATEKVLGDCIILRDLNNV